MFLRICKSFKSAKNETANRKFARCHICGRTVYLTHLESPQVCGQWWANLDQASKHLEVFRFRDLSPTPIP
jgi:hypothetical protein